MGNRIEHQATRQGRRPWAENRWRGHVAAWRKSATTQVEYCRRHGLCEASFSWWKHEVTRRDGTTRPITPRNASTPFVPIQVTARNVGSVCCEIVLRNGQRLRLGAECAPEWIAKVAAALEGSPSC